MSRHTLSGPPSSDDCDGILDENTKTVKCPFDRRDACFACLLRNRAFCSVIHPSCDTHPFNAHTFHGVPAAPAPDHHPQVSLPPADRDHRPQRATDLGGAVEGLLHERRLDLADIG